MRKWIPLVLVAALIFSAPFAFGSANDLAYKGFNELEDITVTDTNDKLAVYDASTDTVKKMDATAPQFSGDIIFRSYLYAMGRGNAASSLASSATNLDAWSVPYVFVRKSIGGDSGLDETDGGTRLPNGYDGQVIVFYIGSCMTDGSWIITPVTRTGFNYITFDAVGETVTLLYVNDTIGWIIIANEGATVTGYDYGAGL